MLSTALYRRTARDPGSITSIFQRPASATYRHMVLLLPTMKTRDLNAAVQELIRKDRGQPRLRELLLAGAASPVAAPADTTYFKGLRHRSRSSRTTDQRRW